MPTTASHIATCLSLTKAISKSRTVEDIYSAALDALSSGLGVDRASILLFDPDGVHADDAANAAQQLARHEARHLMAAR